MATGTARATSRAPHPPRAARDAKCRYELIPDASHNANQDNPEDFNRVLLSFLAEHYPVDDA